MRPLSGLLDGLIRSNDRINAIARSAKPIATVLDFVGNSGRHKLIMAVDIFGGEINKRTRERASAYRPSRCKASKRLRLRR